MTDLLLGRVSGDKSLDGYDVIGLEGEILGRIVKTGTPALECALAPDGEPPFRTMPIDAPLSLGMLAAYYRCLAIAISDIRSDRLFLRV